MQTYPKIAFFDFCETLVDFQTADAFVDFVRSKNPSFWMNSIELLRIIIKRLRLINLIEKVYHNDLSLHKRIKLLQLKGINHEELKKQAKNYYDEVIRKHFIEAMITTLKSYQNNDYQIVIVSGGYDIYLECFAQEFNIDKVISSKIEFHNRKATGKMSDKDCLRYQKVKLLDRYYPKKNQIDSISFSDSITDLPLLKWTKQGVVVSKNKSQKWAKINKLQEIIWES